MTDKKTRSEYFRQWYSLNRDDLNAERRRRYREDEDYRKQVTEANLKRKRHKDSGKTKKNSGDRRTNALKPVFVSIVINGEATRRPMFRLMAITALLGRSSHTIYYLEKLGFFPKTPFLRKGKNERLYTPEMVDVVRSAVEKRDGVTSNNDYQFFKEIKDGWEALGVRTEQRQDGEQDGKVAAG